MTSSLRNLTLPLVSAALITLASVAARAEESSVADASSAAFDHPVPAVSKALELSLAAGYVQGVGDIAAGRASLQDVSGAGGSGELQVGYRLTPSLALGAYGSYARYSDGNAFARPVEARGVTAGVFADFHFRADRSIDPWLGIGSGWRGLWLAPDAGKNTSLQGWEIFRLQGGVDYRVTPEVALGPVLSASVNTFFTGDAPTTTGFEEIEKQRANVFFFAGLQGRFSLFGERQAPSAGLASAE